MHTTDSVIAELWNLVFPSFLQNNTVRNEEVPRTSATVAILDLHLRINSCSLISNSRSSRRGLAPSPEKKSPTAIQDLLEKSCLQIRHKGYTSTRVTVLEQAAPTAPVPRVIRRAVSARRNTAKGRLRCGEEAMSFHGSSPAIITGLM